jgi:hypothetical protein
MVIVFFRARDFRFSAIAMLVLAIILLGSVLGMHMADTPRCGRNKDGIASVYSTADVTCGMSRANS